MKKKLILFTLISCASKAAKYDEIFDAAGRMYNIDPMLIKAHCIIESKLNNMAYNDLNFNGSVDVGICQINSFWYPTMKKHGITPEMLFDPYISIHFSAYVINHNFNIGGMNLNSIGAYNAGWKKERQVLRDIYAKKVIEKYNNLTQEKRHH